MKKYLFVLAAVLPLFSGCRIDEMGFDGSTLYGTVSEFTKTTLGEDGLSVVWAANDSIGVSNATSGNNLFVLEAGSIGKTTGTFKGNISGEPVAAYYPYNPTASSSSAKAVAMTLPQEQTAKGDQPDMSLDVKVAGAPSGSTREGFTFKFNQKLSLLRFDLTPDSEMQGDTLISIILEVKGRTLAGDYTLNLEDPSAELKFASDTSSSVTLNFAELPVLNQGTTVGGWMFVNPDVAKGDSLYITIQTAEKTLVAELDASKDYEAGYRYTMPLDIDALKKAGKIHEEGGGEGTVFTDITKYGVFDLSKKQISGLITYTEGEDQYTTYTNNSYTYYTIVNVAKGKACKTSFSKKSLTVGNSYTIKTVSVGIGLADDTYNTTLVKQTEDMFWFRDDTDKLGFILYR